ncbi:hypothetical protein J4410_03570 [Candidatus Woesearchaeota archaeon]|nr:hypothetical protein [Candidatus Woesearchaeota archaeon]
MADFPDEIRVTWRKSHKLRGGENGHQGAADYERVATPEDKRSIGMMDLPNLGSAPPESYSATNLEDGQSLLHLVTHAEQEMRTYFAGRRTPQLVANAKHGRPVVTGFAETQADAFIKMFLGDADSPFGGWFVFNSPVEYATAELLKSMMFVGIIAPGYHDDVAGLLLGTDKTKDPRNRSGHAGRYLLNSTGLTLDHITGNFGGQPRFIGSDKLLVQDWDHTPWNPRTDAVIAAGNSGIENMVTLGQGTLDNLFLSGLMARHYNSNLVFFWYDGALVGLGDGCGSRVKAAKKAREGMETSPFGAWTYGTDDAWKRVLEGRPFTREQFERVLRSGRKLIAFSDAFYPHPDGYIETTGRDRTDFPEGKVTLHTKKGAETPFWLSRVNYNAEYPRQLIPQIVVQPGGSDKDYQTLALADQFGIPLVFTMNPEQFARYKSVTEGGKLPTGRRFFGHPPLF